VLGLLVLPDELTIIEKFFRPLVGEGAFELRDDAATISAPAGSDLVVTTDMVARDVHFLRDPPETIAKKALRVNLSDLAAKGAIPLAYVLSLGVSAEIDAEWLAGFASGLREDQDRYSIRLLGGDTIAVPDRSVVSITAFGTVPKGRMVRRSGGRPGDILYVSGVIGGSSLGLALLSGERGPWNSLAQPIRDALIARYRVPDPPTALAPILVEHASAAMDVSDGLVGDCDKLCAASGCSAVLEADAVPLPAGTSKEPALVSRLITAGEDFEVLAAVSPDRAAAFESAAAAAGVRVTLVGRLIEGAGPVKVLFGGQPLALSERAFVHGRPKADNDG
jgi:thiamine-monophosphate kinase